MCSAHDSALPTQLLALQEKYEIVRLIGHDKFGNGARSIDFFDRGRARRQRLVGRDVIDLAHDLSFEREDGEMDSCEIGSATRISGNVSMGDSLQERHEFYLERHVRPR